MAGASDRRPASPRRARPAEPSMPALTPRGWGALTAAVTAGVLVVTVVIALLVPPLMPLDTRRAAPAPQAADVVPTRVPSSRAPAASPAPSPSGPLPSGSSSSSTPPSPTPPPTVPARGPGTFVRAAIDLPDPPRRGWVIRYTVQVENSVPVHPGQAAQLIHATLNDPRGWGHDGSVTFVYVADGPVDLTATIATPATTDRMCRPVNTRGQLSCRVGERVVLNAVRWTEGVPHYGGDLTGYRQYLVNHEFGHFLGYDHKPCPRQGAPAPVMVTQTISLEGCTKNPWPKVAP